MAYLKYSKPFTYLLLQTNQILEGEKIVLALKITYQIFNNSYCTGYTTRINCKFISFDLYK